MSDDTSKDNFSSRLLQQEQSLDQPQYEEYRMKLEAELLRAQKREKLVATIAKICLVLVIVLVPIGGSELVGGFDPWNDNANFLSISLGVIYVIAAVTAPILIASYYSRFRPQTRRTRENLMHHAILELHQEVRSLRHEVETLKHSHDT